MVEMVRAVDEVLDDIGAGSSPRVLVLNKADLIDDERREELRFRHPDGVVVSAETGEGLDVLRERVAAAFAPMLRAVELLVPYREAGMLPELHAAAGDLEREETAEGVHVRARLPAAIAARYDRYTVNGNV